MIRNDVTPLSQIDRRAPEAGRIRLGKQITTRSGKKAPASIDAFRFTSPNRQVIEQLAQLYGGTAQPWHEPKANPSNQWEVLSTSNDIRVMLTPDGMSNWYELWAGSGCVRRCDGITCEIPKRVGDDYELIDVPCICAKEGARECKPHTRLQVVLPDIAFTGVWRMETKGWNALHELPGMYELVQSLAAQGRLVEARLRLERRERVTPTGKRNYVVPTLAIGQSLDQLMIASGTTDRAIGPGVPSTSPPALPAAYIFDDPPRMTDESDDIVDAEVVDEETLDVEERLRADGRAFGFDEETFLAAVRAQADGDVTRMRECSDKIRAGLLEPSGMLQGRITWVVNDPTTKETPT